MSSRESLGNVKAVPRQKTKHIFASITKSKEFHVIRVVLGAVFGGYMGHGYYQMMFSGAFLEEEAWLKNWVYWTIVLSSSFGCAVSVQLRCIAALCIPTMLGKSGRSVLHALVITWILAGPAANIIYHGGEAIHSMTCIAKMQSKQMGELIHILHAPVTVGLRGLVVEADVTNKTEKELQKKTDNLDAELWENGDGVNPKVIKEHKEKGDIAGKLQGDAEYRCVDLFEHGVTECKRLMKATEKDCREAIGIPVVRDVLCVVLKATFVCNIVRSFDGWCRDLPSVDEKEVNKNYSQMGQLSRDLKREYGTDIKWKVPVVREETAVLSVDEIAGKVDRDLQQKRILFHFLSALIKKIVGISFIFVIASATSYNTSYLTDFRFDNLYVTSYFRRKDEERKIQGRRHLLPLTRMEKNNLISPAAIQLTKSEQKSMVIKVLKLVAEILFNSVLYLFDYVIYYILHLIRTHARVDVTITGKHILEVHVQGYRTVALLLKALFLPLADNAHLVETNSSNIDCLPRPKRLPNSEIYWVAGLYFFMLLTILLEAYALRLRHVIASLAYHRREKKRIVLLYSDLLRRRKNHVYHIKLTVMKLARNFRLKQRYSLLQAFKLRWPSIDPFFKILGIGAMRCLICDDAESERKKLTRCGEQKCSSWYCKICWLEVGECCWACKNYQPTEEEIMRRRFEEYGYDEGENESEENTEESEEESWTASS